MHLRLVIIAGFSTAFVSAIPAYADKSPSEIAGDTGCAILASLLANPQAAVVANGACVYGTSLADSAVGSLIDNYFDNKDQNFADKYCITIVRADGKKIQPNDKTNCAN